MYAHLHSKLSRCSNALDFQTFMCYSTICIIHKRSNAKLNRVLAQNLKRKKKFYMEAWNCILLKLYFSCQCWRLSMTSLLLKASVLLRKYPQESRNSLLLVAGFLHGTEAVFRGPVHWRHLEVCSSINPVETSFVIHFLILIHDSFKVSVQSMICPQPC